MGVSPMSITGVPPVLGLPGWAAKPLPWAALLLAGVAAWAAGLLLSDAARAWRALLIAFLYFSPLAAGLVCWPGIVRLSRGHWADAIGPLARSAIGFAPVSLAAFVALWLGAPHWAPWYGRQFHQGAWLDPSFLFGRDLACLVLLWVVGLFYVLKVRQASRLSDLFEKKDDRSARAPVLAGILTVLYCGVFTLLGMDLVMALDPKWFSTLFGGYFFMGGLLAALAAWTLLTAGRLDRRRRTDLGNLIIAFSLLATYLMFSQLLPIWYENLPHEVRFVIPRLHVTAWPAVSIALLATIYLGPLAMLLWRGVKTSRLLMGVAGLVLIGMWLERWWMVTPTLGAPMRLGLPELSISVGLAAALVLSMQWAARLTQAPDTAATRPPPGTEEAR
jgi:hypothetical protein